APYVILAICFGFYIDLSFVSAMAYDMLIYVARFGVHIFMIFIIETQKPLACVTNALCELCQVVIKEKILTIALWGDIEKKVTFWNLRNVLQRVEVKWKRNGEERTCQESTLIIPYFIQIEIIQESKSVEDAHDLWTTSPKTIPSHLFFPIICELCMASMLEREKEMKRKMIINGMDLYLVTHLEAH
ncbi:hypothetical protein ACJX0J_013185, partial [Zea mays]